MTGFYHSTMFHFELKIAMILEGECSRQFFILNIAEIFNKKNLNNIIIFSLLKKEVSSYKWNMHLIYLSSPSVAKRRQTASRTFDSVRLTIITVTSVVSSSRYSSIDIKVSHRINGRQN